MKKKPELLAPAGSVDRAKIAFMYGADAVYAGTTDLSLRTRVGMSNDDLTKIVDLAKKMDKKVYAALNIYAFDEDYPKIKEQAKLLNDMGVDAVIVSDGGVVEVLKEYAPNVAIHISTQANTVSLETANFWQKNGAKRIILARELSRDKIKYIMENKDKDLEIEMFIHGAVCVGYSGRCILSNYLTGRAANHGDCAQACRWNYNVYIEEERNKGKLIPVEEDNRGTYLLSAKDLCLINRIPEIVDMGVESLKIEGRLKTEYYIATVVNAYRNAIDEYAEKGTFEPTKYENELIKAKSRNYSELFYDNIANDDIQNYKDGDDRSDVGYEYGAKVIEYRENDFSLLEIRNKISVNDEMELMVPGKLEPIKFTVDALRDVDTNENIPCINPGKEGQKVLMKLPNFAEKDYVVRRKK
ncbi:MAG: U32 family peptidase [Clostridia bacterium]|nr:U32 family peptidase [Clostridia bacterium]